MSGVITGPYVRPACTARQWPDERAHLRPLTFSFLPLGSDPNTIIHRNHDLISSPLECSSKPISTNLIVSNSQQCECEKAASRRF